MTCESLDNSTFLAAATKVVVLMEDVTALRGELVAVIGLEERSQLLNMQRELEPLQSHFLEETRKRGLHDDLVEALGEARRRK